MRIKNQRGVQQFELDPEFNVGDKVYFGGLNLREGTVTYISKTRKTYKIKCDDKILVCRSDMWLEKI